MKELTVLVLVSCNNGKSTPFNQLEVAAPFALPPTTSTEALGHLENSPSRTQW